MVDHGGPWWTLPGGGAHLGVVLQLPPAPYELLQQQLVSPMSGERSASVSPKSTLRLSFGRKLGLTFTAHRTVMLTCCIVRIRLAAWRSEVYR
jgi:hypothetical protein